MKKWLLVFPLLLPAVGLISARAQKIEDSTIVDPNVHKVVFENDHVRRDDAFDHAWELLSGEVHVLLVEVKSAQSAQASSAKKSP
jgi:hypothetical protein